MKHIADIHVGRLDKDGNFVELDHILYQPIKYFGGGVDVKIAGPGHTEKKIVWTMSCLFITKPGASGRCDGVQTKPSFPVVYLKRNESFSVICSEDKMKIFLKTLYDDSIRTTDS